MNIGPGAGTLSHELVHPYMEANFPNVPSWFNEGLASLYERPSEKKGHIVGLPNWRLPNLKKQIKRQDAAVDPDAAGDHARRLLRRRLRRLRVRALPDATTCRSRASCSDFYKKFLADKKDLTGQAALEAVLGEKLDTFEPKWRKWALDLYGDNR